MESADPGDGEREITLKGAMDTLRLNRGFSLKCAPFTRHDGVTLPEHASIEIRCLQFTAQNGTAVHHAEFTRPS